MRKLVLVSLVFSICAAKVQVAEANPLLLLAAGVIGLFAPNHNGQPTVAQVQTPTVRVTLTVQGPDLRPLGFNIQLPTGQQTTAATFVESLPVKKEDIGPLLKVHVAAMTGKLPAGCVIFKVDGKPIDWMITAQGVVCKGKLVSKDMDTLRDNEDEERWWGGLVRWGHNELQRGNRYQANGISTRFAVDCPALACVDTTTMAEGPHSITVFVEQAGRNPLSAEAMVTFYLSRGVAVNVASVAGYNYQPPAPQTTDAIAPEEQIQKAPPPQRQQPAQRPQSNGGLWDWLRNILRGIASKAGGPGNDGALLKPGYYPSKSGMAELVMFFVLPDGSVLKEGRFHVRVGGEDTEWTDNQPPECKGFEWGDWYLVPGAPLQVFARGEVVYDSENGGGFRCPQPGQLLWLPMRVRVR